MYCGPRATLFYFTQVGSTEVDSSVLRNVLLFGVVVKYIAALLRHVVGVFGGRVGVRLRKAASEPTALLCLRLSSFAFGSKRMFK